MIASKTLASWHYCLRTSLLPDTHPANRPTSAMKQARSGTVPDHPKGDAEDSQRQEKENTAPQSSQTTLVADPTPPRTNPRNEGPGWPGLVHPGSSKPLGARIPALQKKSNRQECFKPHHSGTTSVGGPVGCDPGLEYARRVKEI